MEQDPCPVTACEGLNWYSRTRPDAPELLGAWLRELLASLSGQLVDAPRLRAMLAVNVRWAEPRLITLPKHYDEIFAVSTSVQIKIHTFLSDMHLSSKKHLF